MFGIDSLLSFEAEPYDRWLQEENATNTSDCLNQDTSATDTAYSVAINVLVFFTVWGISTVVDIEEFKRSFRKPPIYVGALFQFVLMPFIGFLTVFIFPFGSLEAIAILILTASPGGSYSNWWCSLFNADLALSVSMTSLSTICSLFMLPLNIFVYISVAYARVVGFEQDGSETIGVDFTDLGVTLGIVIGAILTGMLFGNKYPQYQERANLVGNIAGTAQIILGVVASTDTCDGNPPWRQPFFPLWVGTAFPLLVALIGTLVLASLMGLKKPQRVAISLETAYQNSGIALAYTLSQGEIGRRASAVPVIYGGYEAGFFGLFMVASWQMGWTFAPRNENIIKVMLETWQPGSENHKRLHPEKYNAKGERYSIIRKMGEGSENPLYKGDIEAVAETPTKDSSSNTSAEK